MNMTMQTEQKEKPKSAWGWGIAAVYTGFVVFILSIVGYVTLADYQLVEDDYYPKQVAYQDKIDSEARALALPVQPQFSIDAENGNVVLSLPEEIRSGITAGSVQFMRPSNKRLDTTFELALDVDGGQRFDRARFAPGLWRVTLSWVSDGKSYVTQHELDLP